MTTQTPESPSIYACGVSQDSSRNRLRLAITVALTLMLVVLWLVMHRYPGIDNDAQLYAFQALARIHPALGTDLYLQNTSQDSYTIFSPFYAAIIMLLGLPSATLVLTTLFIACFLIAAWGLARELCGRNAAWLAAGALIIIPGAYGGAGVFHFSDNYLTARTPAQALVVFALLLHFRGFKRLGLLLAIGALFVHPLMALPGFLLLICLSLPNRAAVIAVAAGILATFGVALAEITAPPTHHFLGVMDSDWLDVVYERSHFLFVNFWTLADWKLNAQPFVTLAITALAVQEQRIRKLVVGAILIGISGIAVASVASYVAPVAIMVQGQAWRWVWITDFVAILLLAPTLLIIWCDPKCGRLCAMLLILGWTFSALDGLACVSAALVCWLVRQHITDRAARYCRWAAYAVAAVAVTWVLANSWNLVTSASPESGREPVAITRLRNIAGLQISAVMLIGLLWHWLRDSRTVLRPTIVAAVLLALAAYIFPKSINVANTIGSAAPIAEFADWRALIPPTSSVFLADKYDPGSFVWFTLSRPDYLSIDQSAGVVFSRATALEVRRRSEVLRPLVDPQWKLLTLLRGRHSVSAKEKTSAYRPLTAKSLLSVCGDLQLGFVIAKEDVGFAPVRHTHHDVWKDWNLYDCRRVRSELPHV